MVQLNKTALENFGLVLGFIPGVSVIVGAVKAFIYYKKAQKAEKAENEAQQKVDQTAKKIDESLRNYKLNSSSNICYNIPMDHLKSRIYKELMLSALVEMIPFIGIGAASDEVAYVMQLRKLDKGWSFEDQVQSLLRFYKVVLPEEPKKREVMGHVLIAIDNVVRINRLEIRDFITSSYEIRGFSILNEYLDDIRRVIFSKCHELYDLDPNTTPIELVKKCLEDITLTQGGNPFVPYPEVAGYPMSNETKKLNERVQQSNQRLLDCLAKAKSKLEAV